MNCFRTAFLAILMAAMTITASAAKLDDLFDNEPAKPEATVPKPTVKEEGIATVASATPESSAASTWHGHLRASAAYTFAKPTHMSKGQLAFELSRTGKIGDMSWKACAQGFYDPVYAHSTFYPADVRRDQRAGFRLCETYLDTEYGEWNSRLGNQNIVWGEMIGAFVADVVSPRDTRDGFVSADLTRLRLPQWAVRAERNWGDLHLDLVWIPVPTVDKIGKPGADFYPYPTVVPALYQAEQTPSRNLRNMNFGARVGYLTNGWDLSVFAYRSSDVSPTFYRVSAPTEPLTFQARHDSITQIGGTFSKDLGSFVLKGEGVVTSGRRFSVNRMDVPGSVAMKNTLDYAIGIDYPLPEDTRLNVQFIQRVVANHDPSMGSKQFESAVSGLLSGKVFPNVEAQILAVGSLNRGDFMVSPQVTWTFQNWQAIAGTEIYHGSPQGLFGRYGSNDRAFAEVKYAF
jgi:hypothetical protein